MATEPLHERIRGWERREREEQGLDRAGAHVRAVPGPEIQTGQASRVLSTARLQRLPAFHLPPIDVVVSHDPSAAYTEGGLILGRVSHLDAFSGSPVPT